MIDTCSKEYNSNLIVTNERYTELVKKETQLEFVKKWLEGKKIYPNCADISDLLLLLDIKKG